MLGPGLAFPVGDLPASLPNATAGPMSAAWFSASAAAPGQSPPVGSLDRVRPGLYTAPMTSLKGARPRMTSRVVKVHSDSRGMVCPFHRVGKSGFDLTRRVSLSPTEATAIPTVDTGAFNVHVRGGRRASISDDVAPAVGSPPSPPAASGATGASGNTRGDPMMKKIINCQLLDF